ncbi:hypothetical protein Hanom_Chr13g01210681 [Helianthus anomalus]
MEPIKSNHHPSQYPPLDHAEIKSQPFKLAKITALMEVICSFLLVVLLQNFRPMISSPIASNCFDGSSQQFFCLQPTSY